MRSRRPAVPASGGWPRRLLVLLVLVAAACTARPATAESAVAVERVTVPARAGAGGDDGAVVDLAAWYSRPAADGPVPAVLLLHGCSGPGRNLRQWRRFLDARGLAVLNLDSFGARGVQEICSDFSRVTDAQRRGDATAALAWLAARPEIDATRIAVMGFSHGGGIALDLAARRPPGATAAFRAAIAFYPACRRRARQEAEYAIPLQILVGDADDWTPAARCTELRARSRGIPVELEVYPDAQHAFDVPGLATVHRPDVQNINSPTGRGATSGGDPAALAAAETAVASFLERRLRAKDTEKRPSE
ncbi:MAG: dienelactone hydrolase family protein [Alphaproteobacteria bacterium]|nr:dienelactone hydrolase family protein [Alphaproteobacteria bacterium]